MLVTRQTLLIRIGGEFTVQLNREKVILREKNMEQQNSAQKWAEVKVGEQGQWEASVTFTIIILGPW